MTKNPTESAAADFTVNFRKAQITLAARGVAALAGSMKRAGTLDEMAAEEIAQLINHLRNAAQENGRGGAFDEAQHVGALFGS